MANITKRANGTYLIRVSCGLDENGKPIQRSKTFHPSSLSLSESKKQKELLTELDKSGDDKNYQKRKSFVSKLKEIFGE